MLGQSDNILLKTLVKKLGMTPDEVENLDFRPAKITTMSGMNVSYETWLKSLYPAKTPRPTSSKGCASCFR